MAGRWKTLNPGKPVPPPTSDTDQPPASDGQPQTPPDPLQPGTPSIGTRPPAQPDQMSGGDRQPEQVQDPNLPPVEEPLRRRADPGSVVNSGMQGAGGLASSAIITG